MKRERIALFILSFFLINMFFCLQNANAQATPAQIQKSILDTNKEEKLREIIDQKKKKPDIEEEPQKETPLAKEGKKVLVKKISVSGISILPAETINNITASYQNKEVSLRQMEELANLITDAYRKNGYITSRAYLPPQKIENGVLQIRVVEGTTGDIKFEGNRFFKTSLLRKKIPLQKGEPFDYESLRKGLSRINEQPDRNAKAVLMPGKETGTTDVLVEVKDKLPIHLGFDWDTYGSRYIDKDRYRATLTHYNLTGNDDVFTTQYQLSQREDYTLLSLRYLYPLREDFKLGFFGAHSKISLGKELRALNARGKSKMYSIYTIHSIINSERTSLNVNFGFDYKDVFNFQLGNETSRDRLRIAKAGVDLDISDIYGRTLIFNEMDFGIPNILGGLETKDPRASRVGSGGKFFKDTINLLRLQKLPFDMTALWKNQMQLTNNTMTATEQFQIGGIVNVRGYPPAEVVGDMGYSMTWELSVPLYFIPKGIKVPFSRAKLYDAVRFVGFYDWANAHLKNPQPGEEKNKTLRGAGCGIRFNLPEDFSVRLEFAWPLDNTPSDGKNLHKWFEVSKSF